MTAAAAMNQPSSQAVLTPIADTYRKKNVLKLFLEQVATRPNATAARVKKDGVFAPVTWADMGRRARLISEGLLSLGVNANDKVCILAGTRLEWVECDLGVLGCAATTVPIYQSNPAPDCEYIVDNCGAVAIFVEDDKQLAKITAVRSKLPSLKLIITMDGKSEGSDIVSLADLMEKGRAYNAANPTGYEQRSAQLTPDSLLTIIYTSGTTGNPKGAALTHSNMVYEAEAMASVNVLHTDDDELLFLPMAHVFAKLLEIGWLRIGHVMTFAESMEKLVQNMGETRPTVMAAVPRVFEKVYAKVVAGGLEAGGVKAKLFQWAVKLSEEVGALERKGQTPSGMLALQWALAQKLVFKKVEAKLAATLGGRLKLFVSGGAPLAPKIGFFFKHANVMILEGFGMTETSAGSTINRPHLNKIGTVGCAVPGTEVKIAADGEVLIKGPGVMVGYHNNPAATAEAIVDGWMHTGDIGELDADNYLRITDRKKDLIITAGGKNVAPQNIENALKVFPLISQIVVLGDKQKYLAALVTLNADNVKKFSDDNALGTQDIAALAKHAKVREAIQGAIDEFNATQASYNTLKKFDVLPTDFSQETGELTPTLKVKRKFVSEKFKNEVAKLFEGAGE